MEQLRPSLAFLLFIFLSSTPVCAETISEVTELPIVKVIGRRPLKPQPVTSSEFSGDSISLQNNSETSLPLLLRQSAAIMPAPSLGEGDSPKFLVRGQESHESRYFLGEVPLTDGEFNQSTLGTLPLEALGRVDIYAEGVPTFLAEDGLGGAITFHLLDWENEEGKPRVALKTGSFGYGRVFARAGLMRPQVRVAASYTQSSENYPFFDDNGTPFNTYDDSVKQRSNNDFKRVTLLPEMILFSNRNQRLQFFSLNSYTDLNFPGPVGMTAPGQLKTIYSLSAVTHDWEGRNTFVHSWLFAKYQHDDMHMTGTNALTSNLPESSASELASGIKTRARYQSDPFSLEVSTGASMDKYLLATPSLNSDTSHLRAQVPAGIAAEINFFKQTLSLRPAVLAHYFSYTSAESPTQNYFLASPRLGLVYRPLPWGQLRAAMGSYYRAPAMREIYGTPSGLLASPALMPEYSNKYEVGSDLTFYRPLPITRSLRFSYTFSSSANHDLIYYADNSQQSTSAVNLGKSRILLHEASLEWQSPIDISLKGMFVALDGINQSEVIYEQGKQLPYRPPYRFLGRIAYGGERLKIGYSVSWSSPTYTDIINQKLRSDLVEHDAEISWNAKSFGTFGLEVRNISDVTAVPSNFGAYQITDNTTGLRGFPAPGRRMYLTWNYEV